MEGIGNQPFVYFLPSTAGAEDQTGAYERLLDKAKGDVARGIVKGNLLAYASADSARMGDIVVESFAGVPADTMKGVRVLFIGTAADNERARPPAPRRLDSLIEPLIPSAAHRPARPCGQVLHAACPALNELCVNCDVCEPACPNQAIAQGETIYVIDPARCTECVGHFDEPQCVVVCPVECIDPDLDIPETYDQLLAKLMRLRENVA